MKEWSKDRIHLCQSELDYIVFSTPEITACGYGIQRSALRNWQEKLELRELPTLDRNGSPRHFQNLEEFELHVDSIFRSLRRQQRIRIHQKIFGHIIRG